MSSNHLFYMSIIIIFSFFFVSCVPGYYTPCSKWEIFSNDKKVTKRFKIRVCDSKLGYGFEDLSRKDKETISKEVYPKLIALINTQDILKDCKIDDRSINYLYGVPRHNLEVDIICKNKISFEKEDGRYYTVFYH